MARFPGRLALCVAASSVILLSGCVIPVPPGTVPLTTTATPVAPVQVVPVRRVVPRVVTPVTPPVIAPVTPPPDVPCNIFGTVCPPPGGGGGGGDGGELPPDWQG